MNRLRNILICLAVFFTQFIPSYANAMSWNDIKATATAAGAAVSGTGGAGGAIRNAAANVPWGQIKSGLGKGMIAGGLLTAAVAAGLGATDYVMDPANNSVIYKKNQSVSLDDKSPTYPSAWHWANIGYYSSASSACSAALLYDQQIYPSYNSSKFSLVFNSDTSASCYIYNSYGTLKNIYTVGYTSNPNFDSTAPAEQDQTKTISIPDLLQLLIDQMNNNDAAIKNVLDQILESSIAQAQAAQNTDADLKAMLNAITAALDKAATYPAVGTATGTQTTTATGSNLKIEFPVFCGWAGIVCEAAQTAINFPTTVGEWWKTLTDRWTTVGEWWNTIKAWQAAAVEYVDSLFAEPDLPEQDNTVPDSTVAPQLPSANYINFSQSCPFSPKMDSISLNGQTSSIESDMSNACSIASDMKPIVLMLSALISFGIMAGFNFSGSTQDD